MRQFHSGTMPPAPPSGPPPLWTVIVTAVAAALSMAAAVYFAGQNMTPVALVGTTLFVGLGGLSFELARRRSSMR